MDLSLAIFTWGLLAQAASLALNSAMCVAYDADGGGVTLPWQLLTGPLALAAAVAAGALATCLFPTGWTIPGLLLGIFLLHRVFFWHGYPELFTTESASVAMTGFRPKPVHLAATSGLNLAAAALALASYRWLWAPAEASRRWPVLALLAAVAYIAILAPFLIVDDWNTYEPVP